MSCEAELRQIVAQVNDLELAQLLKESANHRREEGQLSAAVIADEAAWRLTKAYTGWNQADRDQ